MEATKEEFATDDGRFCDYIHGFGWFKVTHLDCERFPEGSVRIGLSRGDVEMEFVAESGERIRHSNGPFTTLIRVANTFRVPVSFLEGLIFSARHLGHKMEGIREETKKLEARKSLENLVSCYEKQSEERFERRMAKEAWERNFDRKSAIKTMRRHAEKALKQKQDTLRKMALIKNANKACISHKMPQVPMPFIRRGQLQLMERFSGIYFEWQENECTYVGLSVNVPARVGDGHHRITGDCEMSFIAMPENEIYRAELFYIWLLSPSKNRTIKNPHQQPNERK